MSGMELRRKLTPEMIEVMDDDMAAVIRAKSGAERLKIASGLYASARRMLVHYLRTQHPDWDEQRVQYEASRRMSHGAI
jgi:Rv0078B-related antitoxin